MIQDTLSKVVYTADGLQRQWYIPFQFNDKEDLHIYLTEDGVRVEEIVQNFEIIENGEIKKIDNPDVEVIPAGNYVIYPTEESGLAPLEAGKQILILRETPNTQLEDSSQIYFKSNDVERALDKLTMQVQELTRDSYRAVKVSHFDTTSPEDFTEALFEAGAKAEEAAARAATSESNAALSEQNAASSASSASYSATTAATASANALAAADLARSRANDSLRNAERAEIAAADSNMHASNSAASANTAATLLQQVSNSIYNKAQVDEKISGLQAEIDTVESSIPSVKEEFNQGLSELQTQISAQSSVIAGKQDKLVAGANITINGNVISATGGGGGGGNAGSADIAKAIENQNKVADTVDPIYNWLGTKQEYEEQNIALEHPDWVCFITDDMGEQGGGEGGSSEAKWGAITGDINAQTDLTNLINSKTAAIAEKQDKLTAGEGITIEGNVISATGGEGGGSAELPDNVYTEDNLIAGKNVVFEQTKEEINGEVLGSLNITSDFVVSGFSDDNVIVANDPINETANLQSFEICTSFKLYSTTNCGIIDTAGSAGNARWRITLQDGVVRARTMFYASTVGDVDIYGTTHVQPGVKYNLKYAYIADTNNGMYGYRLWVLPEGEDFRPDNTQGVNLYVERPYVSTTHNTIRLGDNSADGNAMDGELYLKETCINVNDKKAWEAVTVGGKTKISVIGEVDALKTDFSNYRGFPHTIDPQKIDGVLYLQTNNIYRLGLEGHTVLSLPTMPDETTSSNQILIKAYVHPGASLEWGTYNFYNKSVPILQEETYYDLVFDYDQGQLAWVAAAIPSGRTDI